MATDFLHDRAILEALKTVIVANLPATWLDVANPVWGVKTLKVGRLRDYLLTDESKWEDLCPCILLWSTRDEITGFALGGVQDTNHPIRIVHIWPKAGCVDGTTGESIEPLLAQCDRAKTLVPCILKTAAGVNDLSLSAATLTTADTSAAILKGSSEIVAVSFDGEGLEFPAGDYYSVVIDYNVRTVTT